MSNTTRGKYFDTYLEVAKADLDTLGFDSTDLDDDIMDAIARKISKSEAVMAAWWMAVEYAAEDLGIPKKPREARTYDEEAE